MTRTQVDQLFRETFNGEMNFFTPHLITRGTKGPFVYEFSTSDGPATLYGVTVLDLKGEHRHDLSKSFGTQQEATDYIKGLNQ